MGTKEVTLRQCRYCKERKQDCDILACSWLGHSCIHCFVSQINKQREEQAGDKTEFVLIEKPRDQRLGQVIMNNERGQWDADIILGGEPQKKYWDIWEQDTLDIQEKINKLKN